MQRSGLIPLPRRSLDPIVRFRSWLHAGEEAAIVVYSKPYRMKLVLQVCAFAAFWTLFPLLRRYSLGLVTIAAYALPRAAAEGRRAVVFPKPRSGIDRLSLGP